MFEAKQRATSGAAASEEVIDRLDRQIGSMTTRVALLERLLTELQAAKEHLMACSRCTTSDHFPNTCGDCNVMADPESIPAAVSVLWGVDR
jgi:hypothetical protein